MGNVKEVLYVDDEHVNLLLFESLFGKKFTIHTADSGAKGLEMLRNNPQIVLVVSDMKMPEMDGLSFVKAARDAFPEVKFFILTAYDISDEIEDALSNGVITGYFQKPFQSATIERTLCQALDS